MLLGIDIGTTNSKVGLFDELGRGLGLISRETETRHHEEGFAYYDPDAMWASIAKSIKELLERHQPARVAGVGITSMAETGLLIDRKSGRAKSPMMPWFDTCSEKQAQRISQEATPLERFKVSGLTNSFKLGLAKILFLRDRDPHIIDEQTVWLSASSYIAYRLSGRLAFDYSLAARTYAFSIVDKKWDTDWLKTFGLPATLFPEVLPAATSLGTVTEEAIKETGLTSETQVVIGGHDHVCSALAVGAIHPGVVYDSMGTAETLVGTFEQQPLGERELQSGLSFGCHIAPERYFWMGGNSASGGSVEWLRSILAEDPLSYDQVLSLLQTVKPGPTGILYYPYLSGSGAPLRDSQARASFIGLSSNHTRADMLKSVLEGTSYQLEAIRKEAEKIAGHPIDKLLVVGGGTRNRKWLQVKADILNCELELPGIPEASVLGAAMAAGVGAGTYRSVEDAVQHVGSTERESLMPRKQYTAQYQAIYEEGYDRLQQALRTYFKQA